MNEKMVLEKIQKMIYIIRGQRVMMDSDLAMLYGVEVKRLNEQVKRNIKRFPEDFSFVPNFSELSELRSQFVTLDHLTTGNNIKYTPRLFTENGVAMLSSILNSDRAIEVNISIMRIFTKLKSFLLMEESVNKRMDNLEVGTNHLFKIVFERLDAIETSAPNLKPNRKKIGIKK